MLVQKFHGFLMSWICYYLKEVLEFLWQHVWNCNPRIGEGQQLLLLKLMHENWLVHNSEVKLIFFWYPGLFDKQQQHFIMKDNDRKCDYKNLLFHFNELMKM